MALDDFRATLGLDQQPIERGFKSVEAKASALDKVFAKVGGGFASKLTSIFGAGAAIRGITKGITDYAELAKKVGMVAEQFTISARQADGLRVSAERAGISIEQLIEKAGGLEPALAQFGNAGIFSNDDLNKGQQASTAISEFKRVWQEQVAKVFLGVGGDGDANQSEAYEESLARFRKGQKEKSDAVAEHIALQDRLGALLKEEAELRVKIFEASSPEQKRAIYQRQVAIAVGELNDLSLSDEKRKELLGKIQEGELGAAETPDQKKSILDREIRDAVSELNNLELPQEERQKQLNRISRAELKIKQLPQETYPEFEARRILGGGFRGDELSSVGNFLGTNPSQSGNNTAERHLSEMKQIARETLQEIRKSGTFGAGGF